MCTDEEYNFDTSVLITYIDTKLPGEIRDNDHAASLLEDTSKHRVIGGKAEQELNACCDRREDIYDDLVEWLESNPQSNIFEYDVAARDVHASSNDTSHIRYDIQCGQDGEPRRKQLSDLRRLSQSIETVRRDLIRSVLDHIYPRFSNSDLEAALNDLDIGHDKHIIIDAVEVNRTDSIELLVAGDSDITDNDEEINSRIERVERSALRLKIHAMGSL